MMSKLLTDDIDNRQAENKIGVRFASIRGWIDDAMRSFLLDDDKLSLSLIDNSIKALEAIKDDIKAKERAGE